MKSLYWYSHYLVWYIYFPNTLTFSFFFFLYMPSFFFCPLYVFSKISNFSHFITPPPTPRKKWEEKMFFHLFPPSPHFLLHISTTFPTFPLTPPHSLHLFIALYYPLLFVFFFLSCTEGVQPLNFRLCYKIHQTLQLQSKLVLIMFE